LLSTLSFGNILLYKSLPLLFVNQICELIRKVTTKTYWMGKIVFVKNFFCQAYTRYL